MGDIVNKIGICITIPKDIEWSEYQRELDAVADYSNEINFKVNCLPKNVQVGDRCYLCYRGNIIGWMEISSMGPKEFDCSTTGKHWCGNFISRSGPFHKLKVPTPCSGFRGFRYVDYGELE